MEDRALTDLLARLLERDDFHGEGRVGSHELPDWPAIAQREGRVTRTALAEAAVVSERTATRVLGAMVDAGLLVEDGGRGRGAGYVIARAALG